MNTIQKESKLLTHTRFTVLFSMLALNTLFALVLAPLYLRSVNDIGFGFDYLADILDAAILICDLAAFLLAYAVTAYSIFNFSFKKTIPTMLIFSGMSIYKYGLNLVSAWFIYDGIPTTNAEIKLSLVSVISNTALEILQYAVIIFIIMVIYTNRRPAYALQKKQLEKLGKKFDLREKLFPFDSLYKSSNPLQKIALFSAVVVSAIQICQLLIFDIFIGGAPSGIFDVIWMLAYYIGALVLGVVGYLFMLLVMIKLDSHDLKLRQK